MNITPKLTQLKMEITDFRQRRTSLWRNFSHITNHSFKKSRSLKRILIAVLIMIVIIPSLAYFFNNKTKPVSASWWDGDWGYRQSVPVTNSSGSTLTNQRVKISVDTQTLISASKMQGDCDDIRVTDINGSLLDHWDTLCNSNPTYIYVKIPSISTSGTTLFLYYGNPTAINVEKSLGTSENPGTSCEMMKDQGSITSDGVYYIDPGGNDSDKTQVYCDITTLSEGWTLVLQNNGALTTNPEPVWNDAINSVNTTGTFGSDLTAFDLILGLTHWNYLGSTAMVQVGTAPTNITKRATYSSISLNTGNNYALSLGTETLYLGATTPGIKSYSAANNYQFTTSDDDNDVYSGNCANNYGGSPWWYGACWSGSFWGGGDGGGYQNKPFWVGSSTDYHDYGTIYLGGLDTMKNVSTGTLGSEEVTPGPIAYWKFNEGYGSTTNNSTAISALNATLGTNASWKTEDQCISGKCIYIDDSGSSTWQTVYTSDHPSLGGMSALTVGIWIKTVSSKATQQVVYKRNSTGTPAWWSYKIELYSLKPTFYVVNSSGTSVSSQADSAIEINKWYYLTGVYNGSQVQIYVNGAAADSTPASLTGTVLDTNYNLQIGGLDTASSYYVKGYLDEPKIYPYARSVNNIMADYIKGAAESGSSAVFGTSDTSYLNNGLLGYWKTDETSWAGTAGEIIDATGNGNHGTSMPNSPFSGPTTTSAKFNKGGYLDGIDDYLDLGGGSSYDFRNKSLTISIWVKPDTGAAGRIVTEYATVSLSTDDFWVHTDGSSTQLLWSSCGGLTSNTWNHLVGVFDKDIHRITAYKNGIICAQAEDTGNIDRYYTSFIVGSSIADWAGWLYEGNVDDLRTYNRALSPAEVSQLYNFAPGPVAYWNMDEKNGSVIYDKTGNANISSTFSGNTSWTTGKFGSGLYFDGTDDLVRIPETTYTDLGLTTDSYTIEAWFKTSTNFSATAALISKDDGSGTYPFLLYLNSSEYGCFFIYDGTNLPSICGTTALNDDKWHHITGVRDVLSDKIYLYIDSVLINSTTDTTTTTGANNDDLVIGNSGNSYSQFDFTGSIDEGKIYRYARTQSQINEDMNAGSQKQPVAYYKFNEGRDITANNSGIGSSTINGTLTNSPTWTNNGKYQKALTFIRANTTYVTTNDSYAMDIGTGSISISFWAKTSNYTDASIPISKGAPNAGCTYNSNSMGYEVRQYSNYYNFNICYYDGVSGGSSVNSPTFITTDNNWHHLLAVFDRSTQKMRMYVDGIAGTDTNTSFSTNDINSASAFSVGGRGTSHSFDGTLDEIKIYPFALTENEIKMEYNHNSTVVLGESIEDNTDNPIGYWKMDENSGTTVNNYGSCSNCNGTSASITYSTGKINGAYDMQPSTSDYWYVPSNATLDVDTKFTVEAWSTYDTTTRYGIFANNTIENQFNAYISGTTVAVLGTSLSGGTVNPGQWFHTTVTYDGTTYRLYVNGTQVSTDSVTTNRDFSGCWVFGQEVDGAGACTTGFDAAQAWDGKLDEIKIYNYVRSAEQIKADASTDVLNPSLPGAPVAEWKFDEKIGTNAYDTSGNGNTGTITNAIWSIGKLGSSLYFDGNGDSLSMGDPADGDLDMGTNDFSIDLWTWINSSQTSNYPQIIWKGGWGGTTQPGYNLFYNNTDGNLTLRTKYADLGSEVSSVYSLTSNNLLDKWIHISVTVDRDGNQVLYINSTVVDTDSVSSYSTVDISNTTNFLIGGTSYYFTGKVDQLKIYKYVRTSAQVAYDYNRGGPVGYWKLNECQGITANDSSGNGNEGTITIGATGSNTSVGTCTGSAGEAWKDGVTGKYNSSLEFDGTDDSISTNDSPTLDMGIMTISAWIKTGTSTEQYISERNNQTYYFATGVSSGKLCYYINSVAATWTCTTKSVTDNNWHHVVGTWDGTNKKLYIDGVLDTTVAGTGGNIGNANLGVNIGVRINSGVPTGYFNGQIDEIQIFNYALTPLQIKDLFNGGTVRFGD